MRQKRLCRAAAFWITALVATGCSGVAISPPVTPSTLNPQGPGAARLAELWWVMLALSAAVFVLVVVLMFAAIMRGRRSTSLTAPESHVSDIGRSWIVRGGIILPLIVIGITFGYSIYTLAAIDDPALQPAAEIQVIGRRWWWEVHYPGFGFVTANEIHIPAGSPVQVQLQSADVIHSFWVPELHGKLDLLPNRINLLTLQADQPGVFRGQCAEFCGLQHAHMGLIVVAESEEDFSAWAQAQAQQAQAPDGDEAERGQQVFMDQGCVYCHTVRGLDDKAIDRSGVDLGPDLTHVGSRMTIAGASLTMNEGNLAGWIIDPQHVKPGSQMPNMYLTSEDLHALLAYLSALR